MAEIVTVILASNGVAIDRDASFFVVANAGRSGFYQDEPAVLAQIPLGDIRARFQAEWRDGAWTFGKRIDEIFPGEPVNDAGQ